MAAAKSDRPALVLTSFMVGRVQKARLDELSRRTRVASSAYLREAVDDLLAKYARELKRKENQR